MKSLDKICCPICKMKNTWSSQNPFRPFCSERCRLIDLGEWASESYAIPTEDKPADVNELHEDHEE